MPGDPRRYTLAHVTRCGEAWREMQADADGDWVDWEDYAALRARVARLEGAITEATSGIKGAMSSPDYPEPREVLQRVYSHLRAALAPAAAPRGGKGGA